MQRILKYSSVSTLIVLLIWGSGCNVAKHAVPPDPLVVQTRTITRDSGIRWRSSFYVDSQGNEVLHGKQLAWYEDGKRESERDYEHGKRHGKSIQWRENGKAYIEVDYRKGKRHGLHRKWYKNWQLEFAGRLENGKYLGTWTEYDQRGNKYSERTYKNGNVDGKWLYWNGGRIVAEEIYDKNGYVSEKTFWFPGTDRKRRHIMYKRGRQHGRDIIWNGKGEAIAEGTWLIGRPWSGVCGTPAPGSTGWLGVEVYALYRLGIRVKEINIHANRQ